MWIISVEVEQETSAPPPKKNPGSAPALYCPTLIFPNPGASRDTHQTCPPISRIFCLLIGFGENCRVLEWVLKRCNDEDVADPTPIGYVPKPGTINTDGLDKPVDMEKLFAIPKDYWLEECESLRKYYEEQVGEDLPKEITDELNALVARLNAA